MLKLVALVGIDGEKQTGPKEVEVQRQQRPRRFMDGEFLGGVILDFVGTDFRSEGDGDAILQINIPKGWDVWSGGAKNASIRTLHATDMYKKFKAGEEVDDPRSPIVYRLMVPKRSEEQGFTRLAIMEMKEDGWEQRSMIEIRHT